MKNPFTGSAYVYERAHGENVFMRGMRASRRSLAQLRRTAMLAGALTLVAPLATSAQSNAIPARVTDRVDLTRLATLTGNTHRLAQAKYDQGAAPPDLPMNRMMLVLKRSPDQEAALQDLLVQQQVASSASFHKWLTPDQFGRQFGPSDSDIQAVTSWLASFGFQNIKVSRGRVTIEFSGTASQVEGALHTPIHRYVINGESHWANANDPQIPAALAPVISGAVSMHDFRPKPAMVRTDGKVTAHVTPGAKPQIDLCSGSQSPCPPANVLHALVPADFNTIYNVGPSMTGSGVTIGIIATSNISVSDVTMFRSLWGLPVNDPTIIPNGPLPAVAPGSPGEGEAVLDATWAGAVAPSATVKLVVSEDTNAVAGTDLSEFYIVDNNLADVMTESFSACESQFVAQNQLSAAANFYGGMAEQAAAQGITFVVASGDSGPDSCDDPSTLPSPLTPASVNILASTPFNVAVGGTQFNDLANPGTYWNGTSDPMTGGSALSYIPENVWNESCTVAQCGTSLSGLWSSGGGQSIAFLKPPWQSGPASLNIPTTDARFVPDVALTAGDHDGYVICIDGSCASTPQQFGIASGTSASAQAFGGVMALVVQNMGGRVGIANYALYSLAGTETLSSCNASNALPALPPANNCIFNDVTAGDTNIPEMNPQETGFNAGVGYDQATGLGSVNVTNLVNQWHTAIVNATTTALTLNGGTTLVSVVHGTPVQVGITVAPVSGTATPTGDVSLEANSQTDLGVDCFTLNGGASNCNPNNSTILLPGGSYQVHAHYQGDGTFLGSDSNLVSVTVTHEASRINLGIVVATASTCNTVMSVAYGSPYVLTVDVGDVNTISTPCAPATTGSKPSGTVMVSDSFNGGAAAPLDAGSFKLNSFGYFEDQQIQLAVGTHSIQASYQGDNSFTGSQTSAPTVTVTKASTSAAVTPSSPSVAANTTFSLTVTVDTQTSTNPPTGSSGAAPTGMVTFSATTTTMGSVFNPGRGEWPEPNRFLAGEICAAVGCLFAMLFATRRRRGTILLGFALITAIGVGTSCSSSANNSTTHTMTTTLGTANLGASTDANGFAAATATLSNVKLASTGTITATYSGDANYNGSTSPVVTVTVQ